MGKMVSDARDICRPRSARASVICKHDQAPRIRMPKHPMVIGDQLTFGESQVKQQLPQSLVHHFFSHDSFSLSSRWVLSWSSFRRRSMAVTVSLFVMGNRADSPCANGFPRFPAVGKCRGTSHACPSPPGDGRGPAVWHGLEPRGLAIRDRLSTVPRRAEVTRNLACARPRREEKGGVQLSLRRPTCFADTVQRSFAFGIFRDTRPEFARQSGPRTGIEEIPRYSSRVRSFHAKPRLLFSRSL